MSYLENLRFHTLTVKTPARDIKAFLQSGFYGFRASPTLHRHNYTELHLILNGDADFNVGRNRIHAKSGDMLLIPPRVMHICLRQSEGALRTAFQIDLPCEEARVLPVNQAVLGEFFTAVTECTKTGEHGEVAAYMALLCHPLTATESIPEPTTDYAFLIQEFFSTRYSEDIHLSDLADFLCLSERQTERLTVLHTGKTFRHELVATRLAVARHLMESTEMPLRDIAAYVGYDSYGGFWKALKKGD